MNERLRTPWRSYLPDEHEHRVHGQGDGAGDAGPTRVSTLDAMRRHWPIVLATVAALVIAGIVLGLVRDPVYTAEGRVSVQVSSPWPSAVPGSIGASSGLASIYSRAIYAPPLINRVARRMSLSPRDVVDRISATQVPDTGVVRVEATGQSDDSAIRLANEVTIELRRYVSNNLSGSSPQAQNVLRKYKRAVRVYQERAQRLQQLEEQFTSSPSPSTKQALVHAQVQTQAAAVERDGLAGAYRSGLQLYTAPLKVIARATNASSDRVSRLQLFALIGLVAGLAVGAVLATVQANPEARRRLA